MKRMRIFQLLSLLLFTAAGFGQSTTNAAATSAPQAQPSQEPPPTVASIVDREISMIEKAASYGHRRSHARR